MFRWLLTLWQELWCFPYLAITTNTDIPFHAYLLWSPIPPSKAPVVLPKRGSWCRIGDLYWPLPIHSIQQEEPGDTLIHTFLWPPWPPLTTRYAMLFCSPNPTTLCSTSLIWTLTSTAQPVYTTLFSDSFFSLPCGRP